MTSTGRLASGYTITQRVSGSCGAGSEVAGRAYRCFSGHEVIDPCWRATDTAVDCLPAPWSRSVISISVAPLGQVTGTASSAHDGSPWGLTLRDGRRCLALQGAHEMLHGRPIDYDCGHDVLILRGLERGAALWRADSVLRHSAGSARVTYTAGPALEVRTVWWGRPSA